MSIVSTGIISWFLTKILSPTFISDNKSFLRFNNPSKFGDDLSNERPSIKYVNEKKVPISVFETGKILSGFRNIFPIFYNSRYLGSVEVSLTTKSMVDSLEKLDDIKETKEPAI